MREGVARFVSRFLKPFGFVLRPNKGARDTMADVLDHLVRRGLAPRTVIDVGLAYGRQQLEVASGGGPTSAVHGPPTENEGISRRVTVGVDISSEGHPGSGREEPAGHDDNEWSHCPSLSTRIS